MKINFFLNFLINYYCLFEKNFGEIKNYSILFQYYVKTSISYLRFLQFLILIRNFIQNVIKFVYNIQLSYKLINVI